MADLVSYTIPSLAQGISQQPDSQRDPGQGEIQINAVSSIAEGLRKRDNTKVLAKVSSTAFGDCFIHSILRDQSERYLAVIAKSFIRVFELDGTERTVTIAPGAMDYLSSVVKAKEQIRAVSIADFTYILNTSKPAEMAVDLAPKKSRPMVHECLIWVKQASYGGTYTVNVNGTQVEVKTAIQPVVVTGTVVTENRISTAEIAEKIVTGLGSIAGVQITQLGKTSVVWVQSANPITIQANDAKGNADISAILHTAQTFTELPTIAPEGYQVEIIGDPNNSFDGYYVEFKPNSGTFGEGSWLEVVSPGAEYKLNQSTMPHVLVRLDPITRNFWFGPADGSTQDGVAIPEWGQRVSGDYETAPDPSFIGNPINDVFIYKNRLGFLADENIVLSRTREFFDFFPETVTSVLDTDPIDLTASNNRVSILRYAVPYQDELIIFSDQYQFRFNSIDAALTPKSAQITVLTQFEMDSGLRPQQAGAGILFAQSNGRHSMIREFSIRGASNGVVADSQDLTGHVSSYVPANLYKMAVNDSGNSAFFISDIPEEENKIYVYKYFFRNAGEGTQRIQSSWSHWTFNGVNKILQVVCLLENLYLLTQYGDEVYLEVIATMDRAKELTVRPQILLDRIVSNTTETPLALRVQDGIYDKRRDITTWTLPYSVASRTQGWAYESRSTGLANNGVFLGEIITGKTITARGDWSGANVFFGNPYEFKYRFSRFKMMKEIGGGKSAVHSIRTQVRQAKLGYHESGYFEAHVTPEHRKTNIYRFDAITIAVRGSMIGQVNREPDMERYFEGVFNIPIMSKGENCIVELVNSTPHPCKFNTCEWIAILTGKARALQ